MFCFSSIVLRFYIFVLVSANVAGKFNFVSTLSITPSENKTDDKVFKFNLSILVLNTVFQGYLNS